MDHSSVHGFVQRLEFDDNPAACFHVTLPAPVYSNEDIPIILSYSLNPPFLSTFAQPECQSDKVLCVFWRGWNCRNRDGEGRVLQGGHGRRVAHGGHPNALLRVSGGEASRTNVQRRQGTRAPLGAVPRNAAHSIVSSHVPIIIIRDEESPPVALYLPSFSLPPASIAVGGVYCTSPSFLFY